MKSKKVEWKDTSLPITKEYEYNLFIKNRCVFFYCYASNIRKMINYAENFSASNSICVIYVYGAINPQTVLKCLSEKSANILILDAPNISKDDINIIKRYEEWLEVLKKQGFLKITNEGHQKSKYSKTRVGVEYGKEPSDYWFEMHNQPNDKAGYERYKSGIKLIEDNKRAYENIADELDSQLVVYANFETPDYVSGNTPNHQDELLRIIKKLYPYGVEADTDNIFAAKILKIKKLIEAALNGEQTTDVKKLGLNLGDDERQLMLWDDITHGATQCVDFLKDVCRKSIQESGCFNIGMLWHIFKRPPYGAYSCNWYEYLFATAIRDYDCDKYFFGDTMFSQKNTDRDKFNLNYKSGFIFTQNDKQEEFKQVFAKLFDVKQEDIPDTVQCLIVKVAMEWVTENIRLAPLACIDERFHEIFAEPDPYNNIGKDWHEKQCYWYRKGYEEKYLPWIKENFEILYKQIRSLDENFKAYLTEKYGAKKANGFCKFYSLPRGSAVGWLHNKEMIERQVKNYMKADTCVECGRMINRDGFNPEMAYETYVYNKEATDGKDVFEEFVFSLKDIIALNKKLLGRNRDDCLCIPCLAEYEECTEVDLYNMIHEFKEQGCKLFL